MTTKVTKRENQNIHIMEASNTTNEILYLKVHLSKLLYLTTRLNETERGAR